MKILKLIVSGTALVLVIPFTAQVRYGGMQQAGLSYNESGTSAHLSVINGIRFGRYFTGIGADPSFESFRYRTIALYADGRYYIDSNKRFFAKVNAGVNLITQKLHSDNYWYWPEMRTNHYRKQPGFHGVIGIGYKARLGKEVFYSFDLSFGFTQMRYTVSYINFLNEKQIERYDLRRTAIVLHLGFEV